MRLSRGCYDKFHRCPGWVGGGPRYPRGGSRCPAGHIQVDYEAALWRFRFWPCDSCDVLVWPYATRWLSVPYWWQAIRRQAREESYIVTHEWRIARADGYDFRWAAWWVLVAEVARLPRWLRYRRAVWKARRYRHDDTEREETS